MCWVYLKFIIILFTYFNRSCICEKVDKNNQTNIKNVPSPTKNNANPENHHYIKHVKILKELGAYKPHNLNIEDSKNNAYIYINNPVESSLSKTYLTLEEFKKHLIEAHSKNTLLRHKLKNISSKHKPLPSSTVNTVFKKSKKKINTRMTTKNKEHVATKTIDAKINPNTKTQNNAVKIKSKSITKTNENMKTQSFVAKVKSERISKTKTERRITAEMKPTTIAITINKNIEPGIKPINVSKTKTQSSVTRIKPESNSITKSQINKTRTQFKNIIRAKIKTENIGSIEFLTKPVTITPGNFINKTKSEEIIEESSYINNTTFNTTQLNMTTEQGRISTDVTKTEQETTTELIEDEYYEEEDEEEEEKELVKTTKKIAKVTPRPRPYVFLGEDPR